MLENTLEVMNHNTSNIAGRRNPLPLTYYLALEGNSPWNTIGDTKLAFKKVSAFAETKYFHLDKTFIVIPNSDFLCDGELLLKLIVFIEQINDVPRYKGEKHYSYYINRKYFKIV